MKVEIYNNGLIAKVFRDNGTYYYYNTVTNQIIPNNSPTLINLVGNVLNIGCAIICGYTPPIVDDGCCDFSLISNAGLCLVSNAGDCLVSNAA